MEMVALAGEVMAEAERDAWRLFEDEDPKYLAFVKGQLRPPPGGWPERW